MGNLLLALTVTLSRQYDNLVTVVLVEFVPVDKLPLWL